MLQFKASSGSTMLDICLNVYLSLNMLPKFIEDNNITNLNRVTGVGEVYIYDPMYIVDAFMYNDVVRNDYKFVTGDYSLPDSSFSSEEYLLIETSEIMASEVGELFTV